MSFEFTVSDVIPATPEAIYQAWMSSKDHAGMTGSKRAEIGAAVGDAFTAWDGYISGKNLVLDPGRQIVQSWRTTRFTPADADSRIEVTLEAVTGGTRVTLVHSKVPEGHTSYRDGGWQSNYFEPMKRWFGKQVR